MLVKVQNEKMVRDTTNRALMNIDDNARNEYYSKVRLLQTQKEQINTIKGEMEEVRNEMKDIKSLLLKLIEKGSNG
jgi:hypothetical protein